MSVDRPDAGRQAEPAVVQGAPGPAAPPPAPAAPLQVLDDAQRSLLQAVLNHIIPARSDLPGAGDLGAGGSIERTLGESPRLRRLFLDGLTAIQISASRQFVDIDAATQAATLRRIEQSHPAIFAALVEHTYRAYYTLPRVQRALGWHRPPQPLGHTLLPFDPNLLAQQRARAPFWRRPT